MREIPANPPAVLLPPTEEHDELREIREAIQADPGEATIDEVRRVVANHALSLSEISGAHERLDQFGVRQTSEEAAGLRHALQWRILELGEERDRLRAEVVADQAAYNELHQRWRAACEEAQLNLDQKLAMRAALASAYEDAARIAEQVGDDGWFTELHKDIAAAIRARGREQENEKTY